MGKIKTGLVEGQHTFTAKVKAVTLHKLTLYCKLFGTPLADLKVEDGLYYVPGHYFIGLFRGLVPEIRKKDSSFPLKKLTSYNISANATIENRILINQELVVGMQVRGAGLFWIEFSRVKDNEVVLSGLFRFMGDHV